MTGGNPRRLPWTRLPGTVRAAVEDILGDPVVVAASQPGGFSDGSADRIRTRTGTTGFVKAISTAMNAGAAELHRHEANITAALPPEVPSPRLLGVYDDGDWVALVLQDVDGRHPHLPWNHDDLRLVLVTLQAMTKQLTPTPIAGLPTAREVLAEPLTGWQRITADPPVDLDPWAFTQLPFLCAQAATALAGLGGETLVHFDLRADNLLIRPDTSVAVLDWPWACRGPAWLDTLMLLAEVHQHGDHDMNAALRHSPATDVDPILVTAFLAGYAGYFLDAARRPTPPGMATLRPFQHAKGTSLLAWARDRINS